MPPRGRFWYRSLCSAVRRSQQTVPLRRPPAPCAAGAVRVTDRIATSAWRNDRITQAAVGWVLLTVLARYCEDNALVRPRWIGGADTDERAHALDARRAYFQEHPEHTDRDWLRQVGA